MNTSVVRSAEIVDFLTNQPSRNIFKEVLQNLEDLFDKQASMPRTFNTSVRDIEVEWCVGNWEVSIRFDHDDKVICYQALNIETDHNIEKIWNSKSNWIELFKTELEKLKI